MLPARPLAASGIAAMAVSAPEAGHSAEAAALATAPFLTPALAKALGGSMVAAEWRGDYALAARIADANLEQARKSGPPLTLADALCGRAAVALLAGDGGKAQRLLNEAAPGVANDPMRKAWVKAYGYAVHVQRFRLLPGGLTSLKDDLNVQDRMRLTPEQQPDAPAMAWIMTEYSTIPTLKGRALDDRLAMVRATSRPYEREGHELTRKLLGYAPDVHRQRVTVCEADALRRGGRRAGALPALQAARAGYVQAQDASGVLATEILEGDWFAAPLTTPDELNLAAASELVDAWEPLELDARELDLPRARDIYQRAEARARSLGAPRALAALVLRRAMLARTEDDLAGTEVLAHQAMAGFDACGDRLGYWTARWHAALARAESGRPAGDPDVAVALARWGRDEGSYSHAFGLGLIGERAARHSLLRTGSPETAFAIHRLTDTLFDQLGAWLTLVQARSQQASELEALGDKVGAAAAMLAAADAMDRRLVAQRGPLAFETSMKLGGFGASVLSTASRSFQPEAIENAQARASRYLALLREGAARLAGGVRGDERVVGLEFAATSIEDTLRPMKAYVAWLRGLEQLRVGELTQVDKLFRVVQDEAAAPGVGSERQILLTLVMATHLARRNYPAAAALAKSNFDIGPEAQQRFRTRFFSRVPEHLRDAAAWGALWSQEVQQQHSLAFTSLVLTKSFDDAAEHLAALERVAGPRWWQSSQQPWLERAAVARLREGQGRLDEAAAVYREAIGLLENRRSALRADVLKVSLAAQEPVARMYLNAAHNELKRMDRAPDADTKRRLGDQAFDYIERIKARGLLDLLGGARALRTASSANVPGSADDIATLLRTWQRSQMRVSNWQAMLATNAGPSSGGAAADPRQAFLQQKIAEEAKRLAELDQVLAQRGADAPELAKAQAALLNPAQVARLLPPRSMLLQMATLDDDLLLCAVSATGEVVWHKAAMDVQGLRRDMRRLRLLCANRGAQRDIDEPAARIAKALFDPLDRVLAAHEQVVVVPEGPAYTLPFAALPWRGAPLADRLAVTQIPSASVLPFLLRTAPAPNARMLAIGNPARMAHQTTFATTPQTRKPLINAEAEARAVAAGYSGSTVLTGASATAAAVRNALPNHRILHLATHGVLSQEAPMLSSLLLADGEALTLDDLMGMRLDADLAVLSACDTGSGKESDGNDMLGFTRGLLVAGARSAIVSLWPVDDAATRLLMERFYAGLRGGKTSAAALRSAQMAAARSSTSPAAAGASAEPASATRHPYYWAAFVLVG